MNIEQTHENLYFFRTRCIRKSAISFLYRVCGSLRGRCWHENWALSLLQIGSVWRKNHGIHKLYEYGICWATFEILEFKNNNKFIVYKSWLNMEFSGQLLKFWNLPDRQLLEFAGQYMGICRATKFGNLTGNILECAGQILKFWNLPDRQLLDFAGQYMGFCRATFPEICTMYYIQEIIYNDFRVIAL